MSDSEPTSKLFEHALIDEIEKGNDPKSGIKESQEPDSPFDAYIALEVNYGRGSSTTKIQESIMVTIPSILTYRSFLRYSIFDKSPKIKYRDGEIISYETPNGTNLLNVMDESLNTLPQLLSHSENFFLRATIKPSKRKTIEGESLGSKQSKNKAHFPNTELDIIDEDANVKRWEIQKVWQNDTPKTKRFRILLLIAAGILFLIILAISIPLGIASQRNTISSTTKSPTQSPTISSQPSTEPSLSPTLTPTKLEDTLRFVRIKDIVSTITQTSMLNSRSTPQNKALRWLAFEDGANLGMSLFPAEAQTEEDLFELDDYYGLRRFLQDKIEDDIMINFGDDEFAFEESEIVDDIADTDNAVEFVEEDAIARIIRRYALAVLYFATMPTSAGTTQIQNDDQFGQERMRRLEEWIDDLNFLSDSHECSWNRNYIGSANTLGLQGFICLDANATIIYEETADSKIDHAILNISIPNGMEGSLPSEVGNLIEVKQLSINNQDIGGQIPESVGKLWNIESLSLFNNELIGNIPSSIFSNLTKLTVLHLGNNELSGAVPDALWESQLNLRFIGLNDNSLEGSFPIITQDMPSLEGLSLARNLFQGSIPLMFGENMKNLRLLDLGSNTFTGTLPPSIEEMLDLKSLLLNDNRFEGSIEVLSGFDTLSTLMIQNNLFTGAFPMSLFDNNGILYFDVSNNEFEEDVESYIEGLGSDIVDCSKVMNTEECKNHIDMKYSRWV